MSMGSLCVLQAKDEVKMRKSGYSLAKTLYAPSKTIVLRGDLGAGKTTFVQGFADGLGITERVTSPTYALEQRYGESVLSHIDLYRLSTVQANEFMRTLDPFSGIRIIEWSDRSSEIEADIAIDITEERDGRNIMITFYDIPTPTESEIEGWMEDVSLPQHIRRHVRKVADISGTVANSLMVQGRAVRKTELRAAALSHDLLRFVDFTSMTGDELYSPTPKETDMWIHCKKTYGTPHEKAAEKFLVEHGYSEIGRIVRTHRGHGVDSVPETIEQYALSYADKRAIIDTAVTLDERFDDFVMRYGGGTESEAARAWRTEMKRIESFLFSEGVPF